MSVSFGGVGTGRGRGFGRGLVTAQEPPTKTEISNGFNNKPAVSEDVWEDAETKTTTTKSNGGGGDGWGGGNSNNDNTWNNSESNNNSWSGGGGNNRGSGGGGDRGGGPRSCFKCNQTGHMSRDCPEAKSSNVCYNCNQEGHQSRDCTEPRKARGGGGGGGGGQTCYNCNQEGHQSRDCTEPKKQRGGQTCYNCNQEGHQSRDCTEPRKPREGGGACHKCNEEGHMARDCPNPDTRPKTCRKCGNEGHMARECPDGGDDDSKPMKCYKCQGEGHMSRECPNSDASSTACFKCKEEGHMSRECPNQPQDGDAKPRSTYIPPDITEESDIFNVNPQGINFGRYATIPVKASGNNCPTPINTFKEANFRELLYKNIMKAKYTTPTPVQKYAIPILAAKRDLMACAQTGSGKTAAFLLPMINAMFEATDLPGIGSLEPYAVIISPTRELAIQIHKEALKFAHDSIVKPAILYGGTEVGSQASRLLRGCHLLVATPGRLIHFLNDGKISFKKLHFLVLDEADRLLDMGFKSEIEKMVEHSTMPPKSERQTLMFSATFPREVQELAGQFLSDDYLFLEVGIVGAANQDVKQVFYQVNQYDKRNKLLEILAEHGSDKTLVFVEQKKNTDFLASFLSQNDIMTTSIHGDREQREREEALRDFKSGRMKVLVATAVAARGLDITGVRHVINFDLTKEIDEYVHRIGRTGRVGNTGLASSFFDPDKDTHLAHHLLRILADAGQEVPAFLEEAAREGGGGGGGGGRRFNNRDIRRDQTVTSSSFGDDGDEWGSSGATPATNASVPAEEDAWD